MTISGADHFVIAASQRLISASAAELSFEEIKERLQAVRQKLAAAETPVTASTAGPMPEADEEKMGLVGNVLEN